MALSVRSLFSAIKEARRRDPEKWSGLLLHFIGTDYASGSRAVKTIEPIAVEYGISDMVQESTERIPYLEGLRCLLDAHALVVPCSDDPGYTPSKIYPYVLARKPLLVIAHQKSPLVQVIKSTNAGTLVTFTSGESIDDVASRIDSEWLRPPTPPQTITSPGKFAPYSAREMTLRQCEVFDRVVAEGDTRSLEAA